VECQAEVILVDDVCRYVPVNNLLEDGGVGHKATPLQAMDVNVPRRAGQYPVPVL
jgi:hypothetical protein